jgi:glycosyltransferase involved in cell wall biosynthesis
MMLRVFGVLNHLTHQYDMLKLAQKHDVKFSYLLNNVRKWSEYSHRPNPSAWLNSDQFEWVTHYEPGKYDVAILHVDQQHVNPDIGKGWLYRDLNEIIQDIPKIVINHGTPMYDEMYDESVVINGGEILDRKGNVRRIPGMRQKIGNNFMIVNSYTAAKRWGWGYPLIHGLDLTEWWDLPKEPRAVLPLSPGGLDKYYNRELITYIKSYLHEKVALDLIHTNVNYEVKDWDDYRGLIGSSLISLSPYKDSPMPRSRTEAMLSGSCVLSSRYQDAELFIEHGVNGFIIPDNPLSYTETIDQLINFNYQDALEMGQRGKQTAQKYFNIDRYHTQLWEILNEVASGRYPEWDGVTTIYGKEYK